MYCNIVCYLNYILMKALKTILLLSALFFFPLSVFSTAQKPDKIIYQGKVYSLHTNPLEFFFKIYPEKRPQNGSISTNLWRGYVATFEIIDSVLYLKDIEIETYVKKKRTWKSVLKEVFPDSDRVKIDWIEGLLVIPYGKLKNYVHMGYASEYSNYILLEIDKGHLKKEMEFDSEQYSKFRKKQFEAFRKSSEYEEKKRLLREQNSRMTDEFIDSFLQDFVIDYITKILVE